MKKNNVFIRLNFLAVTIFLFTAVHIDTCYSATVADYTASPPFLTGAIPPAVLIILDNSLSMNEFAYKTAGKGGRTDNPDDSFNPATTYYGYFDSSKKYTYISTAGGHFYQDAAGNWDGNFLNWLTMRRVDVIRKVLVGGKATPRSGGTPNYLSVDDGGIDFYKYAVASTYAPFSGTRCFKNDNGNIYVSTNTTGSCVTFTEGTSPYTIKVKYSDTSEPLGVVQATWDKVRYGLMNFNNDGTKYEDGGGVRDGSAVVDNILDAPGVNTNLRTHIENLTPDTFTPLGESLYEATRYFRALMSAYGGGNYAAQDPVTTTCQKNFVIILTDGQSTKDQNLPGTCLGSTASAVTDSQGFNVQTWMNSIATNEGYTSQNCTNPNAMQGTYYLEGVSYWAHTSDLRDGTGGTPNTTGDQSLTIYTVFAFDESAVGRDLLKKSAKYGGFKDSNGNNTPDLTSEWDKDSDGIPDNYYEAQDGAALESALLSAINDILKNASSGTSVSVLTTSASGAGNIFQCYFLPVKTVDNNDITWLGHLLQLGVSAQGEILNSSNQVINFSFNESEGQTYVNVTGGQSYPLIEWTGYNWDAGGGPPENPQGLVTKAAGVRTIKTFVDMDDDGDVDSPDEYKDFTVSIKDTLRPYLRATTDAESGDIINYIRGSSISGYRDRTYNGANQYKLGDIIYSTPTVVSSPSENYGVIYGDKTYSTFFDSNKNRSTAIYIGANDGMLHAFNSTTSEELWAFIPYNLLPHLKWLTDPDYPHVYYVDLRAKVTDINFGDTATPDWRTVLIGGMRLGGGQIDVTDTFGAVSQTRSFRSSYFALDITNPAVPPTLLWEFTHADLGFTSSYPTIAKVGNQWFVIVGSGSKSSYVPNYTGASASTQTGKVFILNARNTGPWTENSNYWIKNTGITKGFMGDPLAVDMDFENSNTVSNDSGVTTSYNTEVVYIGMTYESTGTPTWRGKLYRLVMGGDANPTNWAFSTVFDGNGLSMATPITVSPTATTDELGNLWVYFGTGRFYSTDDKSTTTQHAFFGIRDSYWDGNQWQPCWNGSTWLDDSNHYCTTGSITSISSLYNSGNVTKVTEAGSGESMVTTGTGDVSWDTFVQNVSASSTYRGWYTELAAGATGVGAERVITKPVVIGGTVLFTSFIPQTDVCSYGGTSNLYSLYYKTGTAYKESTIGTETSGADTVVLKSISLGYGMASSPAIHVGQEEGGTAKVFIQTSTGEIQEISYNLQLIKSGVISWREL